MRLFPILLCLVLPLLTINCSGPGALSKDPAEATLPSGRPDVIYVYDFGLDLTKISINTANVDLVTFKQKLRASAMRQLLEALNRAGIASYPFGRDLPPPTGNYWLVDATFYNIDENQNALSAFMGKGRGTHTSEAYVQISGLQTNPAERLLLFETASQPNQDVIVLLKQQQAIDEDAGRIAGLIANFIVNHYQKKGWLISLPSNASGPAKPFDGSQMLR